MEATSRELTPEEAEKSFELDLRELPDDVRSRYNRLYLDLRLKQAKQNQGKPAGSVSLEERQELMLIARTTRSDEEARRAFHMQESWEGATSSEGRPPIGGAQDN
jgi:hypothetical protein